MVTKILLGCSQRLLLDGLVEIISKLPNKEVVAVASNGEEVLQVLHGLICHIAILDVQMATLDGYTTARLMKQFYPHVRVILLADKNKSTINKMLKTEVYGYILKTDSSKELNQAIQQVIGGRAYYSGMDSLEPKTVFKTIDEEQNLCVRHAANNSLLTKREIEIINLIAKGCSSSEIALSLDISLQTVHTHRRNLNKKLKTRSVSDLVKLAIKMGMVV